MVSYYMLEKDGKATTPSDVQKFKIPYLRLGWLAYYVKSNIDTYNSATSGDPSVQDSYVDSGINIILIQIFVAQEIS